MVHPYPPDQPKISMSNVLPPIDLVEVRCHNSLDAGVSLNSNIQNVEYGSYKGHHPLPQLLIQQMGHDSHMPPTTISIKEICNSHGVRHLHIDKSEPLMEW